MNYSRIINELQSENKILLTGHFDPDGDCVGSILALFLAFNGKEKGWQIVLQDSPLFNLNFLPGIDEIKTPNQMNQSFDTVVLVDCNEIKRASTGWLDAEEKKVLVIDHHLTDMPITENMIIESTAAAAGEIVYKILTMSNTNIDLQIATCLYTAIASDTACFRQAHTTSHTLSVGSALLALGVDTEQVRIQLFETFTPENLLMISEAIKSTEIYCGGKVVFMSISQQIVKKYNATKDDFMGVVGFTLCMEGSQIGALFEEREDGYIRVSMRSRKGYTVNNISKTLGGGGHAMAAGATLPGTLEEVKKLTLSLITNSLKENRGGASRSLES